MTNSERLLRLIRILLSEHPEWGAVDIPADDEGRFRLFRSLVNVRPPVLASQEFISLQDEFLRELIEKRGVTRIGDLRPVERGIYLWKGDITALACDAIVNAANSQMLGCFQPCHGCIDNAIHTFAGVQLRLECARLMAAQNHDEPAGRAKITAAYNLPSKFVLHTVGPIVRGQLTERHRQELAECYRSCFALASQRGLKNVAFCCISTGVFGFPQKAAAEIAVHEVRAFLNDGGYDMKVVFNVFRQDDYEIYSGLLG